MRALRKIAAPTLAWLWVIPLLAASGCDDDPAQPPPPTPIESPSGVIDALSRSYQQRDDQLLASLLANDPDHTAEYLFILSDPTPSSETSWGYVEEARLHQRMFHPEAPLPGDTPVDPNLWIQSLTITLSPQTAFFERTDLYVSQSGYLDEEKWRATAAVYTTYLLFELAGDTDYRVEGEANFVVIEDLTKNIGDNGKFLLLIWEDLGSAAPYGVAFADSTAGIKPSTWTSVKELYR